MTADRIPEPLVSPEGVYNTALCRRRCVTLARELCAALNLVDRLANTDDHAWKILGRSWIKDTKEKFLIP